MYIFVLKVDQRQATNKSRNYFTGGLTKFVYLILKTCMLSAAYMEMRLKLRIMNIINSVHANNKK